MASLVVTNTFVASTVIESAKMNTNFDDIETYINNRNSGAATWDNMNATAATITTLTVTSLNFLPAGTKLPFYQASPPTGWTAVAVNDKFIRVVTSGGTGGTNGGSVAASTSLAHTHSISASGTHTHSTPAHVHPLDYTVAGNSGATSDLVTSDDSDGAGLTVSDLSAGSRRRMKNQTTSSGSGTSGAGGDHDHGGATGSSGGVFAYADFCVGTKD